MRSTPTRSPRMLEHLVEAPPQVEGLEQVLLVLVLDVEQVRDHVGEQRGRGHALHHHGELLGRVRQQADRLDRLLLELQEARLDLRIRVFLRARSARTRATRNGQPSRNSSTRKRALALHHQVVRAFGAGDVAHHLPGGADPVQVLGLTSLVCGSLCSRKPTFFSAAHRFLRGGDRARRGPTVIGEITPGKSTVLRIGMMISASSGRGLMRPSCRLRRRGLRSGFSPARLVMRLPFCGTSSSARRRASACTRAQLRVERQPMWRSKRP